MNRTRAPLQDILSLSGKRSNPASNSTRDIFGDFKRIFQNFTALSLLVKFMFNARRAGSDGSMSASGSGDVHFLIARLYITVLD